jgi:hypothetical protein
LTDEEELSESRLVLGDLDGEATRGSTGWSEGGADDGKCLAEDRDEVREEERMHACICGLLKYVAPKSVGPMPGTV